MEQVDARLADANLLAVAHGHDPAACKASSMSIYPRYLFLTLRIETTFA